jgi:hypothetical protein
MNICNRLDGNSVGSVSRTMLEMLPGQTVQVLSAPVRAPGALNGDLVSEK